MGEQYCIEGDNGTTRLTDCDQDKTLQHWLYNKFSEADGPTKGRSDCGLSAWGVFTSCTAKCSGGTKSRVRTVLVPPTTGTCDQPLKQTVVCNTLPCIPQDCLVAQWGCLVLVQRLVEEAHKSAKEES